MLRGRDFQILAHLVGLHVLQGRDFQKSGALVGLHGLRVCDFQILAHLVGFRGLRVCDFQILAHLVGFHVLQARDFQKSGALVGLHSLQVYDFQILAHLVGFHVLHGRDFQILAHLVGLHGLQDRDFQKSGVLVGLHALQVCDFQILAHLVGFRGLQSRDFQILAHLVGLRGEGWRLELLGVGNAEDAGGGAAVADVEAAVFEAAAKLAIGSCELRVEAHLNEVGEIGGIFSVVHCLFEKIIVSFKGGYDVVLYDIIPCSTGVIIIHTAAVAAEFPVTPSISEGLTAIQADLVFIIGVIHNQSFMWFCTICTE